MSGPFIQHAPYPNTEAYRLTAIRAATYWPSVAMKVERAVGTVSAAKNADIIAVRGDVLRYIALLQRVELVIKRGVRYK